MNEQNGVVLAETNTYERLTNLLDQGNASVAVVGLGYVGLPLALTLYQRYPLIAYDIDKTKISTLQEGCSYIRTIDNESVQRMQAHPNFKASCSVEDLKECEVFVLCLPTPLGPRNEPDMSYVFHAVETIGKFMKKGSLLILESTTYPGATDTDLIEILRSSQDERQVDKDDFFLVFSPERECPGSKYNVKNIPKLVGGINKESGLLGKKFYENGGFQSVVLVENARVAECAKLLENTYRAVNIALVNEMKLVFEGLGVDVWKVLEAADTKPFGFQRFNPGPGIGGHCIPVDPFYLAWKAKEVQRECHFIERAALVNSEMPSHVVAKVQGTLNEQRKAVNGSKILLLGVAYKPDVDDLREAPSLEIWDSLRKMGAEVDYHDPYIPVICRTRKYPKVTGRESVPFRKDWIENKMYDIVLVVTNHSCFGEYEALKKFRGVVVDTRNSMPPHAGVQVVQA